MTTFRIKELERLSFEWRLISVTAWEDSLSELADYHKLNGHCIFFKGTVENTKLANWVSKQRSNYWLHQEGKPSPLTTFRIEALESLGLEWDPSVSSRQGIPNKRSFDDQPALVRGKAMHSPEHMEKIAAVDISSRPS
jgi:hypothetical protein